MSKQSELELSNMPESDHSQSDHDSDLDMPPLESIKQEMNSSPHNKNIVIPEDSDSEPEEKDGWLDILNNGDLRKKVLKKGDTDRPPRGSKVTVRITTRLYAGDDDKDTGTGTLIDGETFDKFSVVIGDNDLHQALDLVLPLMELHEVARIIVKPRFAYGQIGNKSLGIPEDATLDCEIELLEIHVQSDNIYGDNADPNEPNSVVSTESLEERIRFGNYKKLRGNFWFERAEYSLAIQCYRGALKYLDANEEELKLIDQNKDSIRNNKLSELENGALIKDIEELIDRRAQTFNNLAASQLKLQAFDQALRSVDDSLLLRPDNVKALYRRAKIRNEKGDVDEAIADLKKALTIDPTSEAVSQELARLNKILARQLKEQRSMYRRMLQVKDNDDTGDKPDQSNDSCSSTTSTFSNSNKSTGAGCCKGNLWWSKLRWPAISAIGVMTAAVVIQSIYSYSQ